MLHDASALYGALHSFGVMLPYAGISALVYALYLRRARDLVAKGHLRRTYAFEAFAVLAFGPLCSVHRAFLTSAGLPPDGTVGLAVLGALAAASVASLAVLAWNFGRVSRGLARLLSAPTDLTASRDLLASVFDASLDGILVFETVRDAEGTIVDFAYVQANPAAGAILDRDPAGLLGKRMLSEYPGNRTDGLFDAYIRVTETGVPWGDTFFYEHDGLATWFTVTAVPCGDGFSVTFRDVTEERQRERSLLESQALFRTAFEDAAVGKALVSPEGHPLRVNPALCAMLGYAEDELREMAFPEFTHPDDVDADMEQVEQLVGGEIGSYELEKRYLHRDGHIVWGLLSVALHRGTDGEALHIIAEVQDITARKETEAALRVNAERLQLLLEVTSTQGLDAQIDEALALATHVLGLEVGILSRVEGETYTVEHVYAPGTDLAPGQTFDLGHTYCSLTLERGGVLAIDHMGPSVHSGHPCYEASRLEAYIGIPVRVGGEVYGTLHFSGTEPAEAPFGEEDYNFLRLLGLWTAHAVERQRATRALRGSEARFRNAFRHAAIGKVLASTEGRLTRVNPAFASMLGYAAEELETKTFADITHPDDVATDRERIEQLISRETESYVREKRYLHREGHVVWGLLSVSSVVDADGAVQHFVAEVMDITARKEADRLKNEFVSMVSHELRTPLTSISGSLRLISAQGNVPDPTLRLLDIASRNSDRLVRLINDLLDVQKIEAGKLKLEVQTKPLADLLRDTIEANQSYGGARGILLCLRQAAPDVRVSVDPDRFMQIMANLISNAMKFSPEQGTVEVSAVERQNRTVRIAVTDYGPGIPASLHASLFGRFVQADSSTTRKQEGTGLGLNITKSLVELHGGRLGFETEEGVGTTFYFDLPLEAAVPAGGEVVLRRTHDPRPALLVVEDDTDVSRVLNLILTRNGFRVDIAADAEQARALAAERTYAAATLDLRLPDADGIALLRDWGDAWPDLPVIVLAVGASERREELVGGTVPVADWLDKPFQAERLLEVVQRVALAPSVPRLLHVEDDPDCRAVTAMTLASVGDVASAATLAEARAAIQAEPFDLVILDLELPDGDGLDLLPDLKNAGVPVAIYSAREDDHESAAQAIGHVVKGPVDHARLLDLVCTTIEQTPPVPPTGARPPAPARSASALSS